MVSFQTGFHGRDVKFSPFNPYRLAVATFDPHPIPPNGPDWHGHLLILDVSQNSIVNTFLFHTFQGLSECAWSRFFLNILIAGDDHGSILFFDLNRHITATLVTHVHSSRITSIDWNPFNSNSFLTSGGDNDVKLWTSEGNFLNACTYTDPKKIYSAIWKPDHLNIFACAGDGTVHICDTRLPDFVTEVGFGENFRSCDWRQNDGNYIATADQFRECIRVWDIRYVGNPHRIHHIEPEPANVIHTGSTICKVKFSPYQTWQIASCSVNSEVALWNSQVGEIPIENYIHHDGPVVGLDMSIGFDRSNLMASTGHDGLVHFWGRPWAVVPNL